MGAVLSPLVLAALHGKSLFWQYLTLAIPFGVAALPVIFNKSPKDYTKKEGKKGRGRGGGKVECDRERRRGRSN